MTCHTCITTIVMCIVTLDFDVQISFSSITLQKDMHEVFKKKSNFLFFFRFSFFPTWII